MNNTDKLLRSFIEASGYEIKDTKDYKEHEVSKERGEAFIHNKPKGLRVLSQHGEYVRTDDDGYIVSLVDPAIDYKVTKRDNGVKQFAADVFYRTGDIVPLPIKSKAWGCIVEYVTNHAGDIESCTNDFDTLKPIWDFMNRDSHD